MLSLYVIGVVLISTLQVIFAEQDDPYGLDDLVVASLWPLVLLLAAVGIVRLDR